MKIKIRLSGDPEFPLRAEFYENGNLITIMECADPRAIFNAIAYDGNPFSSNPPIFPEICN